MVRTYGAYDRKKRKTRIDKGKRRTQYAGKDVKKRRMKHGKLILYKPTRQKTDPIKVWFFQLKEMNPDSYRRWSRKIRSKIRKVVFYPVDKPALVNPDDISTKERLGQVAVDLIGFEGKFQLRMPSHTKNSYHVSFKKKATVVITEHEEGLKATVLDCFALSRYWFWRDK